MYEEQIEKVRREMKEQLIDTLRSSGSMISPEVASKFLGISYRTVYRWLNNQLYLPKLEQCERIGKFLLAIEEIRKTWRPWVKKWDKFGFKELPNEIRSALFNKKLLTILEDGELSLNEKVEELTIKTLIEMR